MGILDNIENAWDENFGEDQNLDWCKTGMPEFESTPMADIDAMGREKFWEDLGRPDDTNLLAQTSCSCSGCTCGK